MQSCTNWHTNTKIHMDCLNFGCRTAESGSYGGPWKSHFKACVLRLTVVPLKFSHCRWLINILSVEFLEENQNFPQKFIIILMKLEGAPSINQAHSKKKRDSPWQGLSPTCSTPLLPSLSASHSVLQGDPRAPCSSYDGQRCRWFHIVYVCSL